MDLNCADLRLLVMDSAMCQGFAVANWRSEVRGVWWISSDLFLVKPTLLLWIDDTVISTQRAIMLSV